MRLVLLLLGVLAVCSVTGHQDDDEQQVMVPQNVLRFILGCQREDDAFEPDGPLPVYHTDIDTNTGTTSQKVTLLDIDQLRESLRGSVHSEEVLDLIIGQLQLNAAARAVAYNNNKLRHDFVDSSNSTTDKPYGGCTVTNNIEVSVPAQEVDDFNDRVQLLIQQNSFLLLEQINTLFTYKLRSLREDFENMVRDRTKKIHRKMDAVLKALNIQAPPGSEEEDEPSPVSESENPSSVSESEKPSSIIESEEPPSVSESTGSSSEVESSTDAPTEMDEQPQEEDTTDTTPTDTSVEVEEEVVNIRKPAPRPVPVPTTIHTRRRPGINRPSSFQKYRPNRYESTTNQRPTRNESTTNTPRSKQRQLQMRNRFMMRNRARKTVVKTDTEE